MMLIIATGANSVNRGPDDSITVVDRADPLSSYSTTIYIEKPKVSRVSRAICLTKQMPK